MRQYVPTEEESIRILAHAAPALFPLLERRVQTALTKLTNASRAGQDLTGPTSEYVALRDLIREINLLINKGDTDV